MLVPINIEKSYIQPRFVFFDYDGPDFAGARVAHHQRVGILQAIELLNGYFI